MYAYYSDPVLHRHLTSVRLSCYAELETWPAVEGVLKGYDQLLNLVLDETVEYARGTFV